jgi:protein-tyrosine phosphatase
MKNMPNKLSNNPGMSGIKASNCVDIHCHCLPVLDDGPINLVEAVTLCKALVADGITTVIATPHQLGRFDGCYDAMEIRKAVIGLNMTLKDHGIPLSVEPGADVRVDERIPDLLQSDRILTLADTGRYILLELPHETLIDISFLLAELDSAGVKAIISHPERNHILAREPDLILRWEEYSPCLQITAASLVGDFGQTIQRAAWQFLDMPFAVVAATDAHNMSSRSPRMTKAFEMIAINRGITAARKLCVSDPACILKGREILHPTGQKS